MPKISSQFAQSLSRISARFAQSPLPRFLRWWSSELIGCLPPRWRQRFQVVERPVLLEHADDGLRVSRQAEHGREPVGQLPVGDPSVLSAALDSLLGEEGRRAQRVLLLPTHSVLRRTLSLPAAALDNLDSVLGFELDRQTPFRQDQVHFDSRVLPHPPDARQVPVQLGLIMRESLEAALNGIGNLSDTLSAVDIDESGQRAGFNFLPPERRQRRDHRVVLLLAVLALSTLFFLWLGMSRVLDNRAEAIALLEAEVDAQRDEARAVTRLREELDQAAAGANFLAVEKASQPSMLLLLDDLTRRLPDDTYLERLSVARGELMLAGQSEQAPKLLELLQDSPLLNAPSLSGPIQPGNLPGKDRFNIAARFNANTQEVGNAPDAGR